MPLDIMGRGDREIYLKNLPIGREANKLPLKLLFIDIFIHGNRYNRQETAQLASRGRQHQHFGTGG